jgi:trimethylamine-N-oxide reductase (cytochrome c)
MEPIGEMIPRTNLMKDTAEHTELILFQGCDPETTPWGWNGQMPSRLCYFFTEVGIKSIYICPDLNYGAAVHADKWIPILPNTDAAMQLAIAHTWITENTYDKEYVATHTVGFDKFEQYVMGTEDGIPKTPKWAADITGVPARITKALAREWTSKRTSTAHCNGGSYIRGPYSTEPARLEVCLLAMQGLGKPGVHQVQMIEWGFIGLPEQQPMPRPLAFPTPWGGYRGWSPIAFQGWAKVKPRQVIPKTLIHEAILNPPLKWYGSTLCTELANDQFIEYKYPLDGFPEIHMIWTDTVCSQRKWA